MNTNMSDSHQAMIDKILGLTPLERAMKVYEREKCARPFCEDLQWHLLNGYVFSTPTMFMMGRPVRHTALYEAITDPSVKFQYPDAWLVYLAVGDLSEFFKFCPHPLPLIGWERENELRWYPFEEIRRKLCEKQRLN